MTTVTVKPDSVTYEMPYAHKQYTTNKGKGIRGKYWDRKMVANELAQLSNGTYFCILLKQVFAKNNLVLPFFCIPNLSIIFLPSKSFKVYVIFINHLLFQNGAYFHFHSLYH